MNAVDLAYAAGIIEGEGSIRINKPTRQNRGALIVSVSNTDRQIIDWLAERWNGYAKANTAPVGNRKQAYVWTIAARQAAAFIMAIYPYLKTERVLRKADLALTFQNQKTALRPSCRSPEYLDDQLRFYEHMAALNKRGRPNSQQHRRRD